MKTTSFSEALEGGYEILSRQYETLNALYQRLHTANDEELQVMLNLVNHNGLHIPDMDTMFGLLLIWETTDES